MIAPPKAFRASINSVLPMVDLRTEIAGVRLRNPTMLAPGFLDETVGSMARVYEAGAGAVRDFTRTVKDVVDVPVFPKLSPNVQDIATFAMAAEEGGADGIVAINTLKAMAITPELKMPSLANKYGGLSGPAIRSIGVRAVYDICEKVHVPVIGVGGVGSGRDALEYIMAGASAVQIRTATLSRGLHVFDEVVQELG